MTKPDFRPRQPCDDQCCQGLFICSDTLTVQRCDTCRRFDDDDEAAAFLNHMLHKQTTTENPLMLLDDNLNLTLQQAVAASLETGRLLRHKRWQPGHYCGLYKTSDGLRFTTTSNGANSPFDVRLQDAITDEWHLEPATLAEARHRLREAEEHLHALMEETKRAYHEFLNSKPETNPNGL